MFNGSTSWGRDLVVMCSDIKYDCEFDGDIQSMGVVWIWIRYLWYCCYGASPGKKQAGFCESVNR